NGDYQFIDLAADDYIVEFVLPNGFIYTQADQGSDDTQDSDADTATGRSPLTSLAAGEDNPTIDAGIYLPASIGDRIWIDLDGDGIQDADEDPITNVRVVLLDQDGVEIDSTQTVEDGRYLFDELPPGTYSVVVDTSTLPDGLVQTYDEDGTLNDNSGPIDLASGEDHDTADFGYQFNGVIGDTIWVDQNQDGIIDGGEGRIADVPVALYEGSTLIATTTTDSNGKYLFTDLPGDKTYRVVVNPDSNGIGQPPEGFEAHPLGDPDVKAGVTTDPDNQTTILLPQGGSDLNADFGYHTMDPIVIGSTIFEDVNGNGVLDAGDKGIPGVSVALFDDASGDFITSVFTDSDGQYEFVGVNPNTDYRVVVQDPSGVLSGMDQTSMPDNNVDGGQPGDSGNENIVSITDSDNLNQDFGYQEGSVDPGDGVIGDTIFFDTNQNNTVDDGEGVSNVTVDLWVVADPSDPNFVPHKVATEITDANGKYIFTGLDTDNVTYQTRVDTSSLPNGGTGWRNTVDPDEADHSVDSDSQTDITLTTGSPVDLNADFGYSSNDGGRISGTIWEDEDESGVLEGDEPRRFDGVTVELRDPDGNLIAVTETDANGDFSFDNLPFGDYTVTVTDINNVTGGFHHTDGEEGMDNNSQNDNSYSVTIDAANPTDDTADFGYQSSTTVPITLASFVAQPGYSLGQVRFIWSTETEVGNIGFRIFANISDQWLEVHEGLLPAVGDSVTLESYEYVADGLELASEFVLVDVDLYGDQVLHGPFTLGETHGAVDKAAEARRALSIDEFGPKLALPAQTQSALKS
ncbi:MAG: carboxypeptidase regulatory-like domain-containing protein, partial [Methylococcales bacterium]|nr:carboxypeptidase regulatory-like domain-containing protein [Methylococcales bacterium]